MPALELSDEDIANVLTYVYSSWGNAGLVVTPEEVATERPKVQASH
jgi:nitrite reductase (NO-forming)